MADVGPRDAERDRQMVHYGRQVARGLRQDRPGDAEGGTGWRGELQVAADQSRQDREILRLADEIYVTATLLTTSAEVRTYAEAALQSVTGPAAVWFLRGMLDRPQLETGHDTEPVT